MRITRFKCWLGATLLYGYLFYDQSAGINFLLFNAALLAGLFSLYPTMRQQRAVKMIAIGCLLTALNVVWHPTWPAVWMNLISLLALAGLSTHPQSSLFVAWINSGYSLIASFWKHTLGRLISQPKLVPNEKPTPPTVAGITAGKVVSQFVPLLVVALFFLLYTQASPAFSALFDQFSLDFISGWWVIFTLCGGYLLLTFFYPVAIHPLLRIDLSAADELRRQRRTHPYGFNPVGLRYEYRSAWRAFILLNILLLVFNAVDIAYLSTGRLPEEVTYKEFLHQGVNTLIISVVLAIAVVMYFLRESLNFLSSGQRLKYAAYAWITQNAVLVGAIAVKNVEYVERFGLTHRRIGVYVYLLLTLIGLAATWIKVRDTKSNWFLVRRNGWAFYVVLVAYGMIDWNYVITQHSLARLEKHPPHMTYLLSLSDVNLDMLASVRENPVVSTQAKERIQNRIESFIQLEHQEGWQSWNYRDHLLYQRLIQYQ
jgi:hypothetical protein